MNNAVLAGQPKSLSMAGRNGCGSRQDLKVYVGVFLFSEDQLRTECFMSSGSIFPAAYSRLNSAKITTETAAAVR